MEQTKLANLVGKRVTAMTYADDDRELPPKKVTGTLQLLYVSPLDYIKAIVDGVGVDPSTVSPEQE